MVKESVVNKWNARMDFERAIRDTEMLIEVDERKQNMPARKRDENAYDIKRRIKEERAWLDWLKGNRPKLPKPLPSCQEMINEAEDEIEADAAGEDIDGHITIHRDSSSSNQPAALLFDGGV